MVKKKLREGHGVWWGNFLIAACAGVATLWTTAANATITQGDFSVFGFFETRESGRWGEGATRSKGTPTVYGPGGAFIVKAGDNTSGRSGGSFDFNRWDLVQARQIADIRPDYHIVKNYKLLGRFDTLILKDADFFAFYRPWYDAFGTLKPHGISQPDKDYPGYTQQDLQQQYFRNDLREYYGQLNFTDNFSMRIGKQQVIWSEADALSGTELTNTVDLSYHWTHFETPENLRKNVRMIKANYIVPDFLKTANNEVEGFVIPGDYEGNGAKVNVDFRNPWNLRLPEQPQNQPSEAGARVWNKEGGPIDYRTISDLGYYNLLSLGPVFADKHTFVLASKPPSNSIQNSEFGFRYSSLLPIGNGLQASFIYLYEARDSRVGLCTSCYSPNIGPRNVFPPKHIKKGTFVTISPGIFLLPGVFDFGTSPATLGTIRAPSSADFRRNHFFDLTGTYYDKDLTDIVYRYDFFYAPKVGVYLANPKTRGSAARSSSAWTEQSRFIIAGDRPTYIPWLSKQHTFITAQYVNTWYPDRPSNTSNNVTNTAGKLREDSSLAFIAFTNWLVNGQLTATNAVVWDIDDQCGLLSSTNVFRYSRNILLGVNAIWYMGRSGRYTDPFFFSSDQRINEIEATFSYEI